MRAVVQRVKEASVSVEGKVIAEIGAGLLVLLGISEDDTEKDIEYIADKCVNLRIFEDAQSVMNLSLLDVEGELLLVSQFTLYGDIRHGRRPSYIRAARPERARELFAQTVIALRERCGCVQTGEFQADMDVSLVNDGPVTILIDSKKEF